MEGSPVVECFGVLRSRPVAGRLVLMAFIPVGLLAAMPGRGTLAFYTASAQSTTNSFTSGSVAMKLTDADETSLATVTGSIGSATFRPGDTVVGYVTVENSGTLPY